MARVSSLLGNGLLAVGCVILAAGCSSSSSPDTPLATAGMGGMVTGTAGTPTAGSGGGMANGGTSPGGAGGTVNGGAGGSVAGAGGNAAGAAGSPGGAGGAGGASQAGAGAGGQPMGGAQGMQADPGTAGDGSATQPEPYDEPAEVTGLVGGAVEGQLIGPMLYASPTVYSNPAWMFNYYIYVPAEYEPGKPAALMVFQDDVHYLGMTEAHFNTPTVFSNLIHAGEMPVTIGLFIGPGTEDGSYNFEQDRLIREEQYSSYNANFATFLIDEIIADVILSAYDIVNDPDGWAIGGHSSGGNCSLIVGMHRSDKFHKILTHNGAFDNADRVSEEVPGTAFPGAIDNSPLLPLRVNLLSGPNDIPISYQYNQSVINSLMTKGYHFRYIDGNGMHYPPVHAVHDYPDALRWLWRGYTLPWYQ